MNYILLDYPAMNYISVDCPTVNYISDDSQYDFILVDCPVFGTPYWQLGTGYPTLISPRRKGNLAVTIDLK